MCSRVHSSLEYPWVSSWTDQGVEANVHCVSEGAWLETVLVLTPQCMLQEYRPPTLFLTFTHPEYDSLDLKPLKVNDVSDSYSIGKMYTEDPVSKSQCQGNFHDFFQTDQTPLS